MMWSKLFQDSIYSTIDILEKFRLISDVSLFLVIGIKRFQQCNIGQVENTSIGRKLS